MTTPPTTAALDHALTAQIVVAWAGENGEEGRLRWWKSDLVSEYGGKDLFIRLLPDTWDWAVLQAAREAARRHDGARRAMHHDADRILSLYALGFESEEWLEERLQDLKRSGRTPSGALPGLVDTVGENWDPKQFALWVEAHGRAKYSTVPVGRRIETALPEELGDSMTNDSDARA